MTKKQFITGITTIFILAYIVARTDIQHLFSLNINNAILSAPPQTIPTRTHTPSPTQPIPTATKNNNGGSGGNPVATSTTKPQATATEELPVTIAFTPVGGLIPTAEPCSNQPTLQAINSTNVRLGPGTNYITTNTLVYLEVRPIIGRATDAAWWLIHLEDGSSGWVADEVAIVQGYIGNVPIVPAPEVDGQTPTPGSSWNPTPFPLCTVTPTPIIEPTKTLPPTATVSATGTTVDTAVSTTSEVTETPTFTVTPPPQPTQTAVSPPTLAPTTSPILIAETTVRSTDSPLNEPRPRSTTDLLLPIAGVLFLGAGVAALVNRRKQDSDQ